MNSVPNFVVVATQTDSIQTELPRESESVSALVEVTWAEGSICSLLLPLTPDGHLGHFCNVPGPGALWSVWAPRLALQPTPQTWMGSLLGGFPWKTST